MEAPPVPKDAAPSSSSRTTGPGRLSEEEKAELRVQQREEHRYITRDRLGEAVADDPAVKSATELLASAEVAAAAGEAKQQDIAAMASAMASEMQDRLKRLAGQEERA